MIHEVAENIYSIEVELPNNPLRWLNTYYIAGSGEGRSLVIDTGFHMPECREALLNGLRELNADFDKTDVFITHLHSDHCGNADVLEKLGCRIIMGRIDYEGLNQGEHSRWPGMRGRFLAEGISQELINAMYDQCPAAIYMPGKFSAETVEDGDTLSYGGYNLRCILTPGHTPGHMCLYDEARALMFTGDHVLFDISPNITFWAALDDSLGSYLDSLRKVRGLDVGLALPAHRNLPKITLAERIDQLLAHHERRIGELEQAISDAPGSSALELTAHIKWKIRARNWDEFPLAQKWFAIGETIAHLDHMLAAGMIRREETDSGRSYFLA